MGPSTAALCQSLVGRSYEVEQLRQLAGDRAVTFIAGEAGVGKSRLAREAAAIASELGLAVFTGGCQPVAPVAYGPFVSALRRHCRALGPRDLDQLFAGPAHLAVNLMPEVAEALGSGVKVPSQDALFAAYWHLGRRLAGEPGALLVLEDLHWADADSLRLLEYLVTEVDGLNTWVVGTYRSEEVHRRHPLGQVLGRLSRQRRYQELDLAPLDQKGLGQMVSAIFGVESVSDELVSALAARTMGNPFFVEELVRELLDQGAIYRQAGSWERRELAEIQMPDSVRDTLTARADALAPVTRRALQSAAVLGERIDREVLAHVSALSADEVEEVVQQGVGAQLLEERQEGHRVTYAFRHALTREALAAELLGPQRRQVHRQAAEALLALHQGDPGPVAAELAQHFRLAGLSDQAVDFGLMAARQAISSAAEAEMGERYEAVLKLMGPRDDRRLPALLEAAEAFRTRDPRLARAFGQEALDLGRSAGDRAAQSQALSVIERAAWASGDSPAALEYGRQAYELARGMGTALESLVIAHYSRDLTLSDRHQEAAALIRDGLVIAEKCGDHASLAVMHGSRMLQLAGTADFDEVFRSSVEAAKKAGDLVIETITTINAGYICLWSGDFNASLEYLVPAIKLESSVLPRSRYAHAGYGWLLSLMGRMQEARVRADDALSTSDVPTHIVALTALCEVALRQQSADLADLVQRLWSSAAKTGEAQRAVPAVAARARAALAGGQGKEGVDLSYQALAFTTTNRGTGSHWMFSPDLARYLAREGRTTDLRDWYARVNTLTCSDPHPHNRNADDFCLGLLASADGDTPGAIAHLRQARDAYRQMPCPARQAEVALALADLYWRNDQAEESLSCAHEAQGLAAALGATGIEREAAVLVTQASTPPVLATVLFTDIVGSTETLALLGDKAWKSVLERHNSIVRRELARWGGREIDTTGDGFLAAFDSPAAGARCALAIRDALAGTGTPVRAGLHTGECQVNGKKLAGLAVHIAARVAAQARAGEVLASGTVADLVAGSSLEFEDRGLHELKGVPGRWRLTAVSGH